MNKQELLSSLSMIYEKHKFDPRNFSNEVGDLKKSMRQFIAAHPTDLNMKVQYAVGLYVLFGGYEEAMNLLIEIVFTDESALGALLLAYLQDIWEVGIFDDLFQKLVRFALSTDSNQLKSLLIFAQARYWRTKDNEKYKMKLLDAIEIDPTYSQHFFDLGVTYARENNIEKGKEIITLGLQNVKKIYAAGEVIVDDILVDDFIDHFIKGLYIHEQIAFDLMNRPEELVTD